MPTASTLGCAKATCRTSRACEATGAGAVSGATAGDHARVRMADAVYGDNPRSPRPLSRLSGACGPPDDRPRRAVVVRPAAVLEASRRCRAALHRPRRVHGPPTAQTSAVSRSSARGRGSASRAPRRRARSRTSSGASAPTHARAYRSSARARRPAPLPRSVGRRRARERSCRASVHERAGMGLAVRDLGEPHGAGHYLWHLGDPDYPLRPDPALAGVHAVRDVYAAIDEAVGAMVDPPMTAPP